MKDLEESDSVGFELKSIDQKHGGSASSCSSRWSRCVIALTSPLVCIVQAMSRLAAAYPKATIIALPTISIAMLFAGLFTNFNIISGKEIWAPVGSKAAQHGEWLSGPESQFGSSPRIITMVVHSKGNNVLGDDFSLAKEGVQRVLEVVDEVKNVPGYEEVCAGGFGTSVSTRNPLNPGEVSCMSFGVGSFYYDDLEYFEQNAASDEAVVDALSAEKFPNGLDIDHSIIIGNSRFFNGALLEYGESYVSSIFLPGDGEIVSKVMDVEKLVIDRLLNLQGEWENEDSNFRLEFMADRTFGDEFNRVIVGDLPLMSLAFALMCGLCLLVFHHKDRILSRKWLGVGAVVTVLFSVMFSYGLLFCIGVPFTSMTPLVPFIIFGVGLDVDTFIIYGSYLRTDPRSLTPEERIEATIKDVGPTILLTTLTSFTAFSLGLLSSIPAVKYLVCYASTCILMDFIFQITYFVALLLLDERRIQENRLDCCFFCPPRDSPKDITNYSRQRHISDRIMAKYGRWLLQRPVSVAVIIVFIGMFGVFTWSATQLTQYFSFESVLPQDSYMRGFMNALGDYSQSGEGTAGIYFRDVDFSNSTIQAQMKSYVKELSDYGGVYPERFWLEDLERYASVFGIQDLPFEDQLDRFLSIPMLNDLYGRDIVRDSNGAVIRSRTFFRMTKVQGDSIEESVQFVNWEQNLTSSQEVNKGLDEWKFFTFSPLFYIWEFFSNCPKEFASSIIIGVVAVTLLAVLFVPHWTSAFYVGGVMTMVTLDLLGFMRFFGVTVGPVSYVICVMSIGLMVDHVLHVVVRYMEIASTDRKQRSQETLETIGASLLLGGASTFIGILPVSFSTSETFMTVFIIFCGLILLGVLHGLMFIPCVLSIIGTRDSISHQDDGLSSNEGTLDSDDQSNLSISVSKQVSDKSISSEELTSTNETTGELLHAPSITSIGTRSVEVAQSASTAESGQELPIVSSPSSSDDSISMLRDHGYNSSCSVDVEDDNSESIEALVRDHGYNPSCSGDVGDDNSESIETVMVKSPSQTWAEKIELLAKDAMATISDDKSAKEDIV
ncbi:hypothetical protein ACHAWF_012501 [Thalassiosira exigua]